MPLDSAVLDAMLAAGATPEVIVAAVKAANAKDEARLEAKRANNAERQRRFKERHGLNNVGNALLAVSDVTDPAPNKSPPDPQKLTPTPGEHTHTGARGVSGWKLPAGVDGEHWNDFLANRRTKRLGFTPTAYRGQLKALEALSDDEWPPGRIVQFAAERGWGAFFDPRGRDHGQRNGPSQRNGSGHGRTVDAALDWVAGR